MRPFIRRSPIVWFRQLTLRMLTTCACGLLVLPAFAGPGAHGPNGEHLDAPVGAVAVASHPRAAAHTETFELVAELKDGALTILVDRYETNEPVLGATLEVESGSLKARAVFRPDQGDYVITEPALIQALSAAGQHSLVLTLIAGQETDLLDASLTTLTRTDPRSLAHGHGPDRGHGFGSHRTLWGAAGLAAVVVIAGYALRRRQQRQKTVMEVVQ